MGCATGKPESHTKKATVKQDSSNLKPSNLNHSQENPQLRNQPKPIVENSNPITPSPVSPVPQPVQSKPIKTNLEAPSHNAEVLNPSPQKVQPLGYSQTKNIERHASHEVNEVPALPIETPTKSLQRENESNKAELSAIPERTDDFESVKKTLGYPQSLKQEERKEELGQSRKEEIRISVPQMKEEFMVSNISKNTKSAEKVQNDSGFKKMQLEASNEKNIQNQDLRTEEIKINVIDGYDSKLVHSNSRRDEFAVLNEEQFDLNCQFDPNTLVIDMNKVAW